VTNQTSGRGTICKAVFPEVVTVRHAMIRPALSHMVSSLFHYSHALETGMQPLLAMKETKIKGLIS